MKLTIIAALLLGMLLIGPSSQTVYAQAANHVVISEVYGGGGNSGSTYKNDFVELYNPTSSSVDVSGWSVQYASATGTSSWQVTNLTGTIAPHGFFLVGEAAGTGGTVSLPTPDVVGTLALSSTAGKIALVSSTSALSGANPASASLVDKVGFGTTANGYEGSGPAPAPSNSTSIERKANSSSTSTTMGAGGADEIAGNGYDSDNNANDFVTRSAPQPQNSASPVEPSLVVGGNGTGTAIITPSTVDAASVSSFTISIAGDGTNTLDSVIVIVPAGWGWSESAASISLSGSGIASGTAAVSGDTIFVGKGVITQTDSCKITISSLTAPDTSLTSVFIVETALNGGTPIKIGSLVTVTLIKIVHIVDLHINDSQGVPAIPYQIGAAVTVSGIITGDFSATQTNIFVQDATGGVCVYRPYRSYNYQVGDSVTVTGTITQFRGLIEISPDSTKYVLHSSGNPLPDPFVVTTHDVNETFNTDIYTEPNEGRLVRINNVTYSAANGTITDATGTAAAFLPSTWTAPTGNFDLIGILKQYKPGTPVTAPYTANYEVDPRTSADVLLYPGPVLKVAPYESNILPTSVVIKSTTIAPSIEVVKYGITSAYTDSISSPVDTAHAVALTSLRPSTVYHYQVAMTDSSGSNATGDAIFITGSTSSDSIGVFFNKTVNYSVAQPESAKQLIDLSKVLLYRISRAQHSIDMCTYSFSGTAGATIASALITAHNRGVKIRVIGEHDNIGTAPWGTLRNAGIVVIDDAYDLINAGNGLMHNKFYVFDHRDTSLVDWVVMGSWNATDPGTNDDAQNMIEIQDRSLAEAYTIEFNEMWGSSGDSPNQSASRFGIRKTDNTPHRFVIGGMPMELYFSPSDKTTSKINAVLNAATSSINVCMYTFTRDDLAQTLIAKMSGGTKVHVVMDNNTDTGNEFATLQSAGMDVHLKAASLTGLLHHKYAVIDADKPAETNVVVTGSHNWSSAAETANNENTLIIHSKHIANLYLQEFKQRYVDAGGSEDIVLSVNQLQTALPTSYGLQQNYPNPFNPSTRIQFSIVDVRFVSLKVYDILGRSVATLVNERMSPGVYTVTWNAARLSSGIYLVRLEAGSFSEVRKIVLMK